MPWTKGGRPRARSASSRRSWPTPGCSIKAALRPLQLLFGHEPVPVEGELLDPQMEALDVTVSMAERLARRQSAMKAWLQAEAEARIERAQNRRTRLTLTWEPGSAVSYWRADNLRAALVPAKQGNSTIMTKAKGAWLGPAVVLAQERSRHQEPGDPPTGYCLGGCSWPTPALRARASAAAQ